MMTIRPSHLTIKIAAALLLVGPVFAAYPVWPPAPAEPRVEFVA